MKEEISKIRVGYKLLAITIMFIGVFLIL